MHHRSSRSTAKASSANFGSCPLAVSVAVVTSDGGTDLLEGVGVAVEGELAQRPPERRPEPAGHGEHRAADLDRPLVVEDAERGRRLPVRHALVLGELARHVERAVDDDVVGVRRAVGDVGVDEVREAEQHVAQGGRHALVLVGERPLLLAEAAALGLLGLGGRRVAGAAQLADLLRQLVDPGPGGIAAGRDLAQVVVERGGVGELVEQGRIAAPGGGRAHGVGIAAQQADVDHESVTLPADRSAVACGSPRGGTRANSFSTSAYVSGSSSWPTISADGISRPRL